MATFNEPELCLVRDWTSARLLEDSMEATREKYAAIFEKVLNEVQEKHDQLDCRQSLFPKRDGRVGIGKKAWPSKSGYYISGFWLGGVLLENLTSEDEDHPHNFIWVNHPDGTVDLDDAQRSLDGAAKTILTREELRRCSSSPQSKGISWIWYPLQQSRQKLLAMLIKNDARDFIACMAAHFESMVRFTGVMDEIYRPFKHRKKNTQA